VYQLLVKALPHAAVVNCRWERASSVAAS